MSKIAPKTTKTFFLIQSVFLLLLRAVADIDDNLHTRPQSEGLRQNAPSWHDVESRLLIDIGDYDGLRNFRRPVGGGKAGGKVHFGVIAQVPGQWPVLRHRHVNGRVGA